MRDILILPFAGIGTGWLIGITKQEVIVSVITAVLTLLITVVTYLSGIRQGESSGLLSNINTKPISILIFFLAVGVACGIWMRTHNTLGDNRIGAHGWTKEELERIAETYGKDMGDVQKELFRYEFPGTEELSAINQSHESVAYQGQPFATCDSICINWEDYKLHMERGYKVYEGNSEGKKLFDYMKTFCKCKD